MTLSPAYPRAEPNWDCGRATLCRERLESGVPKSGSPPQGVHRDHQTTAPACGDECRRGRLEESHAVPMPGPGCSACTSLLTVTSFALQRRSHFLLSLLLLLLLCLARADTTHVAACDVSQSGVACGPCGGCHGLGGSWVLPALLPHRGDHDIAGTPHCMGARHVCFVAASTAPVAGGPSGVVRVLLCGAFRDQRSVRHNVRAQRRQSPHCAGMLPRVGVSAVCVRHAPSMCACLALDEGENWPVSLDAACARRRGACGRRHSRSVARPSARYG